MTVCWFRPAKLSKPTGIIKLFASIYYKKLPFSTKQKDEDRTVCFKNPPFDPTKEPHYKF
jgi:hypothetical protein